MKKPTLEIDDIDTVDWKSIDEATAFHLISKHAESINHAGKLIKILMIARFISEIENFDIEILTPDLPDGVNQQKNVRNYIDGYNAAIADVEIYLKSKFNV